MQQVVLNWSSGKDAATAFYYLQQDKNYHVSSLLTTVSEAYQRVSMHGVSREILALQAQHMNIPLKEIYLPENADMEAYNQIMKDAVTDVKAQGIDTMAFGDIFLEDLRKYREEQLATQDMKAIFPLWKKDTKALVATIEDIGIKAMIVCVNDRYLGQEFLGRCINRELLNDLPAGVDPCGENGEYHTLVIDAPFFKKPLPVTRGEIVHKKYDAKPGDNWDNGFYYLDITEQ